MASSTFSRAARTNLDLDTLRTLAVASDRGGLAQAAEHLGRTPSAISLQMKRLQEDLGTPIFRKRGRGLALTEAGEIALSYARRMLGLNDELLDKMHGANLAGRIRLGCPQDFASILPSVLSLFASLYPRMQIELHVDGNAALRDAIDNARLDVAIIIGHEDRAGAQIVGRLALAWIASSTFVLPKKQPLPLAVLGSQCIFRRTALQRLEAAHIPHRISANSHSLNGLWAALLGGLGITARTPLNLPEGLVCAESLHGLPPLGSLPVTLHRHAGSQGVTSDRMASLLVEALEFALQSNTATGSMALARNDVAPRVAKHKAR
ncbi:MAG TPA: LysR substrate-binding domain-containing protein [Dyella sp.]|uniref:LysR substrate-binding domain-containing protein n=1 Tax=Dyella sp. TaxID=1869338 RepID=UPI002F95EEDD